MRVIVGNDARSLFLVTMCLMAVASASGAQSITPVGSQPAKSFFQEPEYREAEMTEARRRLALDRRVLRSRFVAVDFDALGGSDFDPQQAEAHFATSITLDLFHDLSVTAIQDRVDLNPAGGYSWIGHAEGHPDSAITLVVRRGVVSGGIQVGGWSFQVGPVADGTHVVSELTGTNLPPELPSIPFLGPPAEQMSIDPGENIDLLVVYTAKAEAP